MKRDLTSIILTRQELQIMKVVWRLETATVRDVCNIISQEKPTAYTTILTLMGILEDKGVLTHSRVGRAYVYKPLLSRHQATGNQVDDMLTRFFDGDPVRLMEYLVEYEIRQPEQIESLRALMGPEKQHQVA